MQAVRIIVEATQAEEVRIDEDSSPSRRFDPRGTIKFESVPVSPRKQSVSGLRLGILDNSNWKTNKLPRGAPAALSEDIKFAAVNYYVKESFSKDAVPPLIAKIGAENDVVLTAIGAAVRAARLVFLTPSRSRSWGSPARS